MRRFDRVIWLADGRIRADGLGSEICAAYEADIARRVAAHALRIDAADQVD